MHDYFVEVTIESATVGGSTTGAIDLFDALDTRDVVEIIQSGPQGTAGTNGTNGARWYNGPAAPSNTVGVAGDFYLCTADGNVYTRDATTWSYISNIKPAAGSGGNFVPNPNFLDGVNGYTSTGTLSLDSSNGLLGPNAASMVRTSNGDLTLTTALMTIRPNITYSAVAWVRLGTLGRIAATVATPTVRFYDSANTELTHFTGTAMSESIQGTWTLLKVLSFIAPANAAKASIEVTVTAALANEAHFVGGFSLQTGDSPLTGSTNFPASTLSGTMLAPASITSRETAAGSAKPLSGAGTSRPAATGSGRIFAATDTGFIYLDVGSWLQIGGAGGASSMPAEPVPLDFSLIAWTYDPMLIGNNVAQAMTAGVLGLRRIIVRNDTTITNILTACVAVGAGLANTYFGLYNPSGTLLAQTAECSAQWTSLGLKTLPLTSPLAVTAGTYYVGWVNGTATTTAKLACGPSGGLATSFIGVTNMGTTAMYRSATYSSGFSALPTLLTTSTATADSRSWWFALS